MSSSLDADEAYARALQQEEYGGSAHAMKQDEDAGDAGDEHVPPPGSEFAVYLMSILRDIPDDQMAQSATVMKSAVKKFEDRGGKAEPLPKEALALLDNDALKFTTSSMWHMMSRRRNNND